MRNFFHMANSNTNDAKAGIIRPVWATLTAFLALWSLFAFTGCGSQRTTVHQGSSGHYKSPTVSVQRDTSRTSVLVDEDKRLEFEATLKRMLNKRGFTEGDGLILKYWAADADEGSRSARFWLGFGIGSGRLQVAVEFFDSAGNRLATTDNVGTVSGGFTGGSYSEAIVNTATAIADFTKKNFYGPTASVAVPAIASAQQGTGGPAVSSNQTNQATPPTTTTAAPASQLSAWRLAVITTPAGALIQAYDANQKLYEVGKSPVILDWPPRTTADALVVFWQGRQVNLMPTPNEAISIDFTKSPPVITGATVLSSDK